MHQSFRFGPEIAYVSALLLTTLKGVRRKTLIGSTDQGKSNITAEDLLLLLATTKSEKRKV